MEYTVGNRRSERTMGWMGLLILTLIARLVTVMSQEDTQYQYAVNGTVVHLRCARKSTDLGTVSICDGVSPCFGQVVAISGQVIATSEYTLNFNASGVISIHCSWTMFIDGHATEPELFNTTRFVLRNKIFNPGSSQQPPRVKPTSSIPTGGLPTENDDVSGGPRPGVQIGVPVAVVVVLMTLVTLASVVILYRKFQKRTTDTPTTAKSGAHRQSKVNGSIDIGATSAQLDSEVTKEICEPVECTEGHSASHLVGILCSTQECKKVKRVSVQRVTEGRLCEHDVMSGTGIGTFSTSSTGFNRLPSAEEFKGSLRLRHNHRSSLRPKCDDTVTSFSSKASLHVFEATLASYDVPDIDDVDAKPHISEVELPCPKQETSPNLGSSLLCKAPVYTTASNEDYSECDDDGFSSPEYVDMLRDADMELLILSDHYHDFKPFYSPPILMEEMPPNLVHWCSDAVEQDDMKQDVNDTVTPAQVSEPLSQFHPVFPSANACFSAVETELPADRAVEEINEVDNTLNKHNALSPSSNTYCLLPNCKMTPIAEVSDTSAQPCCNPQAKSLATKFSLPINFSSSLFSDSLISAFPIFTGMIWAMYMFIRFICIHAFITLISFCGLLFVLNNLLSYTYFDIFSFG